MTELYNIPKYAKYPSYTTPNDMLWKYARTARNNELDLLDHLTWELLEDGRYSYYHSQALVDALLGYCQISSSL